MAASLDASSMTCSDSAASGGGAPMHTAKTSPARAELLPFGEGGGECGGGGRVCVVQVVSRERVEIGCSAR